MACRYDPDCGLVDVDGSLILCITHQIEREEKRDEERDGKWLPPGHKDAHREGPET